MPEMHLRQLVGYYAIAVDDILDIHKYLMNKNNILTKR